MKIIIDSDVLKKHKLSQSQFYYLLHLQSQPTIPEYNELINKLFYIGKKYSGNINPMDYTYFLSNKGSNIVNQILLESNKGDNTDKRIEDLAKAIQGLFPPGMKPGTPYYWRGNLSEIKNKLITFFKMYGEYSDEVIIDATERYISTYQLQPRIMQLCKYFIWKKVDNENKEYRSELLTFIENKGEKTESLDLSFLI